MNAKTRALLVACLVLVAQLACSSPLPGLGGAGSQLPGPVYTLTSVPPFPTDTATPRPTLTTTATRTPRPTYTPTSTATRPTPLSALTTGPRSSSEVTARYLSTPPTIDGDWSEWKGLTDEFPANTVLAGKNNWTGPEDLSSSFHLGWTEYYLYLAIKIRDDQYVQSFTGADMFKGDSLELLLDTQLKEDKDSTLRNGDDFRLGISAGHPHLRDRQEAYLWTPYELTGPQPDVVIEARAEPGIYRVEVAIPWSVFGVEPEMGQHYGFALSVSDCDSPDAGVQQSLISNVATRDPSDPTTWGDLLLVR